MSFRKVIEKFLMRELLRLECVKLDVWAIRAEGAFSVIHQGASAVKNHGRFDASRVAMCLTIQFSSFVQLSSDVF